jgi:hypothetical protein
VIDAQDIAAEIFQRTRETFAGFIHDFDPRSVFDVSAEERQARFEELWAAQTNL